jgi:hypothetical protein
MPTCAGKTYKVLYGLEDKKIYQKYGCVGGGGEKKFIYIFVIGVKISAFRRLSQCVYLMYKVLMRDDEKCAFGNKGIGKDQRVWSRHPG